MAAEGESAYREFNFSPSGQWAAYRFAGERQRDTSPAPDLPAPVMQLAITPTLLTLDVHLPLAALPSSTAHVELALCGNEGLCANDGLDRISGVGVGIRWRSPLGPIRIDLARPVDADRGWRLHLSMGPDL